MSLKRPPPSPEKDSPSQRSKTHILQIFTPAYAEPLLEIGPDTWADPIRKKRSERREYPAEKTCIGSFIEETGDAESDAHFNLYEPKMEDLKWVEYEDGPLSPPESDFVRARRAGCLLPDPLQQCAYYRISRRSRMARRVSIWTVICNRFVSLGYHSEVLSLRLVDYQLSLIASHAMSRLAGVCFIEPILQYTEPIVDRNIFAGMPRILPPLPKCPPPNPKFATYQLRQRLQFIPRESNGGHTVLTFEILRHLDVGPKRAVQRLYGKILAVASDKDPMGDSNSWKFLQLPGHEFEAYIFDPLYIDFEKEGNHVLRDDDDRPIALYDKIRLESSQSRFYSTAVPMEILNAIKPAGQVSPLFRRTFQCRLFHPSRELYNERACPVLLVPSITDMPLWRITELPRPISPEIASKVINAFRAILDKKLLFGDYLDSIRTMEDGSVLVVDWEDFIVGEVDENDKNDLLEWHQGCDELIEDLKVGLAEMGMR
jgi:hypothetical protein